MKFSIVTPSFGQLDWLRLAVASVRDQITGASAGMGNGEWEMGNARPESEIQNPKSAIPPLAVEHIIQDAGTPGIEEFAREVGADFHRDGELVFRGENADCGMRNAKFPGDEDHPESHAQNPAQAPAFHENPANPVKNSSHSSFRISNYSLAIFTERDKGMYDAINRGLRRSSGEICAWLNCDEQYLPNTLASASAWLTAHPNAAVLCGDVVVTDAEGNYLCSRTALPPQRLHTLISGNLSFLSAATFFRRSVVDAGHLLPDKWQIVGDAAWAEGLIRERVRFGTLRKYLAAFADTGENLSVNDRASREKAQLARQAPAWAKFARPLIIGHFRIRKMLSGAYRLHPFSYSVHSRISGKHRMEHAVGKPTQLWPGRIR